MNEAPFSTNFVLYANNGLRCQHTVRSESSIEAHVALVDAALAALMASGHTVSEAGLEAGQESHDITGYVVSTTSKGDKVLHLYTDYFDNVVHGGAVYEDKWDKLPFVPNCAKIYDGEGRLSKEGAKAKGYLVPHKFKAIVERTEKLTDAGKNIWKFVSAVADGAAPAKPAAPQQTAPAVNGDETGDLCSKIISHLSSRVKTPQNLVDASLRAFARRQQLGEECWELVQKNIRGRLVLFVNEATSDTQREELEAAVRAIGKVLPDGIADIYLKELADAKSTVVPF